MSVGSGVARSGHVQYPSVADLGIFVELTPYGVVKLAIGLPRQAGAHVLAPLSQAGWERLGDLAGLPQGAPLQRLGRPRLIEVQHEIELLRQPRMEVVTDPLALR